MSDPVDYATNEQAFAEAQIAAQLEEQRRARERDSGVTHCVDCDDEILAKRRELMPYATRCVDCQSFVDRLDRRR